MTTKIALEEHFVTPGLERCVASVGWSPSAWRSIIGALTDIEGRRLELMDACGIERAVLSLGSDGVQGISDRADAIAVAHEANDVLAAAVARCPDRFSGFAALPMQDAHAAAVELRRAVRELGCVGALVNGFSNCGEDVAYYDQPEYEELWATVEELGVPFYLHPRNPRPGDVRALTGRPELLGPTWAFGVETGTHALRLIVSGVFDRHPDLQVVLGHLGETLPFAIARLQQRLAHVEGVDLARPPRTVLAENFWVTISGNYHTPSLVGVILEMGADRILFAADHPFEEMADASTWFDALPISAADSEKIARGNAVRLLGL
jgi:predicted TIM-barrel fold metal-dependent hydrolase